MNKKYCVDCTHYTKNGKYIPGSKSDLCIVKIDSEDPAKEDRKNRNQVVHEIEETLKKGASLENACKSLVEKYKDTFKYLPKENLAMIFANWYSGRHKDENKSIEERTC